MTHLGEQGADTLVDIRRLSIGFDGVNGDVPIVRDVDLRIDRGECVALVGESGSGKSLIARSLLHLAGEGARIEADRFLIEGRDARLFRQSDWRRLRGTTIGLVMQDALGSLDPLRTIGQEVAETLCEHGLSRRRREIGPRVLKALGQVGLPHPAERASQYAHQLSGGLRQRALIASAIVADPALIIADEPTTSLDVTVQAQVLEVLAERVRQGAGLLLISHDLAVVAGIADRVCVMRSGRIVESGPTAAILRQPRHAYTRQLLAAIPSAQSRGSRLATSRGLLAEKGGAPPLPLKPAGVEPPVLQVVGVSKRYARSGALGLERRSLGWTHPSDKPSLSFQRDRASDRTQKSATFVSDALAGFAAPALHGVSFEVKAGEIVGIVGESGSGKSTCAKIVLGLLAPDAGEVRLLGERWSGIAEHRRRPLRPKLQYVPQDALSSFDPRFRVSDVIGQNVAGELARVARRARIATLLEQVGLDAGHMDRHPRSLSGGQRQRVAIARALAAEPRIIVCDEPVSALDICIQAQVLDLLIEIRDRLGTALLFISHDLGVVQHIADRVLVFQAGRIVETGLTEDLFAAPRDSYTKTLIASIPHIGRGLDRFASEKPRV